MYNLYDKFLRKNSIGYTVVRKLLLTLHICKIKTHVHTWELNRYG